MLTLRDMDILIQTAGVLFNRRREMKDALAAAAKRITDWDESEEGQRMAASVVKTAAPFVMGLPVVPSGPNARPQGETSVTTQKRVIDYAFQATADRFLEGEYGKTLTCLLREVYQAGFSAGVKKAVDMIDESGVES